MYDAKRDLSTRENFQLEAAIEAFWSFSVASQKSQSPVRSSSRSPSQSAPQSAPQTRAGDSSLGLTSCSQMIYLLFIYQI